MDLRYDAAELGLRQKVKDLLARLGTPELARELAQPRFRRRRGPLTRKLYEELAARGLNAISWPRELGGQDGSKAAQFIVEEELIRADIPVSRGGSGLPSIVAHGTDEQRAEFLAPAMQDDVSFALGFTEPGAGSDLAGVRCRARREGDAYVIDGEKVYTSAAHEATHIYLLVRTDPASTRQQGLSILLVPVDTPGITVYPLQTLQNDPPAPPGTIYGDPRTNRVSFDSVVVPVSARLGAEGDGWRIAQGGLNLDRIAPARYLMSVRPIETAVSEIAANPELGFLRDDAVVMDKLAELWIEAQVCRLFTLKSVRMADAGQPLTYEAAAEKVWAPEHGIHATESIAQILGPVAQLLNGSPLAPRDGVFAHNLMGAFQSSINHGSVQVMRDQVARRGLGMPRQ
jgi:3-oxocholest-4-en-26-oyl-CoA dehydrogenase alpha subunit